MSKLSIGLVTSPSEESNQLIELLEQLGVEITFHISPDEISNEHIQAESLNVWLLNVNDDDWHDNIDNLLDESEASIYFNEPGNLSKQSHPQYWSQNLVSRLYELTGLDEDISSTDPVDEEAVSLDEEAEVKPEFIATNVEPASQKESGESDSPNELLDIQSTDSLTSALDELETNSVGLPSEIAADLVSELESISPELEASIEESVAIDHHLQESDIDLDEELSEPSSSTSELQVDNLSEELQQSTDDFSGLSLEEPEEETNSGMLNESEVPDDSLSIESEESNFEPQIDMLSEHEEKEELSIEEENHDISDEIMSLVDEEDSISLLLDSENSLESEESILLESDLDEEIDLTHSVNPVLESAREDDQALFQSVYDIDSDQQPTETEEVVSLSEDPEQFMSDLEPEQPSSEDGLDYSESSTELLGEELLESEFSLEEMSDEPSELEISETPLDTDEPEEYDLSEFSLESMEEDEKVQTSGKAVFIEEEADEEHTEQKQGEQESSVYDDGGLTLESIGDEVEPASGRAQFVIDDSPTDEELESGAQPEETDSQSQEPEQQSSEFTEEAEEELSHLSLEPQGAVQPVVEQELPTEEQATEGIEQFEKIELAEDLSDQEIPLLVEETELSEEGDLSEQAQLVEEIELVESVGMIEELEIDQVAASEQVDDASEGLLDFEQVTLDQDESESFEIPMLDDAATGLEFEEPEKPAYQPTELCSCWVIGASLGGPAAVKRFLQSLPEDINASFIITQHIDENFLPVLADILTTSSSFDVKVANGSNPMTPGKIYLAPLKGKIIFLQDGSMLVDHSQKWSEPYSPCIDDVIESLSSVYKEKSGAIIFSGMGQDGLNGAKKMKALGGTIWAQSVDTCANPSMPDAVISEELTSVVASPEVLADQLADHLAS